MDRRRFLGLLGGTTALGIGARHVLLPPSRSAVLASAHDLTIRLYDALEGEARARACVEYDHPFRQYHNRGVWGGGLQINPLSTSREARRIVNDLLYAALSEPGRDRIPNEFFTQIPGVHSMKLLICGDPKAPPYQVILTGAHLNLRIGGKSKEGVAFGGPLVYGDQRGDSRAGLPGNLYRFQFEIAHRLFSSLRPDERRLALQKAAPIQTQIELQGEHGTFVGLPIASSSKESRTIARELIDAIFSSYPAEDVAYAWSCIAHNGGPEAMFLSYYEDGEIDRSGQYQIFRLEGPAAVLYFRGAPHVHAFINVAMNGDAPLSVGEVLGENPRALEGDGVRRFFEAAMREAEGTDFSYYPRDKVAGRLRAGPIRTGDIYTLESWQDPITVLEIKGRNLGPELLADIRSAGGTDPAPDRVFTVAVAGDDLADAEATFGAYGSSRRGASVRDAAIAHFRRGSSS